MVQSVIDEYRALRAERLEQKHKLDELEKQEQALKDKIIERLRAGHPLSGVTLVTKNKPSVEDWNALYAYIRENNAFELLHRRVTETAVQERWNEGEKLPGVSRFPVFDIKLG